MKVIRKVIVILFTFSLFFIIADIYKEKEISEDDERRASDDIQKITDKYIETIDSRLSKKESELMEV